MYVRGAWVALSRLWSIFRHFTPGRCPKLVWGWTFGPEEARSGTDSGIAFANGVSCPLVASFSSGPARAVSLIPSPLRRSPVLHVRAGNHRLIPDQTTLKSGLARATASHPAGGIRSGSDRSPSDKDGTPRRVWPSSKPERNAQHATPRRFPCLHSWISGGE